MKQKDNIKLVPSIIFRNIFMFLLVFASFTASADNNTLASEAEKAYEKEQYKTAISNYEKIIASGEASAALYYNLGNAYFKDQQIGKAIYNYELAHKLNPADADIKTNLTIANKLTRDDIEQKENYFAKNIESGILNIFSTTGWAWVTIIALAFATLFFILFKITSSSGLRKLMFWLGSLSLLKCFLAFVIGFMALNKHTAKTQAIVLSPEVKVMNTPTSTAKSQFTLHEGTKVNILQTNKDWTSIILENGNEGWVHTTDIGVF